MQAEAFRTGAPHSGHRVNTLSVMGLGLGAKPGSGGGAVGWTMGFGMIMADPFFGVYSVF